MSLLYTLNSTNARRHFPIHSISRRSFRPLWRNGNLRNCSAYTAGPSSIHIHSLKTDFPYIWLRDSCQGPVCVHPSTQQKLHRSSDVPASIAPREGGIYFSNDVLLIDWIDGHRSRYHISFLSQYSSAQHLHAFHKDVMREKWDSTLISAGPSLFVSYDALGLSPTHQLVSMRQLLRYGLLFVTDVPTEQSSDERCELRALAEIFGKIRPTFYGEVWDVKNIRERSRNIAYTNLDLGLHMDLMYMQHPPQYQILHCLKNRVVGGASIFSDTLHAASMLRVSHPDDFHVLANTDIAFHYINDGHHLRCERPTIELSRSGEIVHVNYSPPFQAPLSLSSPPQLYTASRRFTDLVNDPSSTFTYTLKEGDAVLFDNRRVLHARTAFHEDETRPVEGESSRWLKGCYLDDDTILDKVRTTADKYVDEQ
ncbi:Clavaminate synthase-like protein [Fistulina hepatica ATCC 64428]|uniref:Clavaminate synthase-like protein n=1 Tax=Fistulina hepatica ATCC 64428 TaxID=1128425 RepID=A0A0D6ZZM8_9AGAR|nr:Clavaminate synthase-like protein [Fistulina hepatica ATCC 64428]